MWPTNKRFPHHYLFIGGLGCLVFLVSTILGPVCQLNPFYNWYYLFAWWPYILVAETILAVRGNSLLFNQTGRFFLYGLFSVLIWLVFEAFNFRLQNWHYLNVPSSIWIRWTGYFLSFASVLPGLIVTRKLLHITGLDRIRPKSRPSMAVIERALPWSILLGSLFLILPIIWPRYFFPVIWVSFLLILEPILYRYQVPSLLRKISYGDWSELFGWLYSGALCGFLWETWNYWAGSKWYYTIPYVGQFKVFEMPILGFLGFPPFALQSLVMARLFFVLKNRYKSKTDNLPGQYILFVLIIVGYIACLFWGIDMFTVVSYKNS